MEYMSISIVGHIKQLQALMKLMKEQRLPSSLLFSGARGIGKKLVAHELAKRLLCQSLETPDSHACGSCKSCILVEAQTHPDLCMFECNSDNGGVNELRTTLERLQKRAFMGGAKITVLNDADTLSVVGANILLKTLEEPRANSYFILIAETPSRLPQTVLSRCQRWFFDRLSDLELTTILKQQGDSLEKLQLVPLAEGSMSTLESLDTDGKFTDEVKDAVDFAWQGNQVKIVSLAQKWAGDKNLLKERISLIKTLFRNKLTTSASDRNSAAIWANALQTALETEHLIFERNVNPTLALIELLKTCCQELGPRYRYSPNAHSTTMERLIR